MPLQSAQSSSFVKNGDASVPSTVSVLNIDYMSMPANDASGSLDSRPNELLGSRPNVSLESRPNFHSRYLLSHLQQHSYMPQISVPPQPAQSSSLDQSATPEFQSLISHDQQITNDASVPTTVGILNINSSLVDHASTAFVQNELSRWYCFYFTSSK